MSKGRVLVVDDEYGIRSGVDQILELEGYEVEEAETGEEALRVLEGPPFEKGGRGGISAIAFPYPSLLSPREGDPAGRPYDGFLPPEINGPPPPLGPASLPPP